MVVFHVINSLLKLLQYIIFHTNVKGDPISAPNNNTHAITTFNQLIINSIHQLGQAVCLFSAISSVFTGTEQYLQRLPY